MKKEKLEAGKLVVKSLAMMMKIGGMTTKEKADKCIGRESVKEWQARVERVQIEALEVGLKVMIEE